MFPVLVFTVGRNLYEMIVLKIESVKEFMSCLFTGDMFDKFHTGNCEVTTFTTFQCDGKRKKEWYDTGEVPEDTTGLLFWKELKPVIFSFIKGKKTPLKMCLNFCHYMPEGDVGSIRVQYEKEELLIYTGYMQKEFSLDKQKQFIWDENCLSFMKKNKIVSTQFN